MKKFLLSALVLLMAGTSAFGAFYAKTFEAAKKRKPKDGILVYFYGADWDYRGPKMLETHWGHTEIKSACGNAAMVACPVYQNPSEKEKKQADSIRAGMKVPHIFSYPAIVMYDADGLKYHIIYGDEIFQPREKLAEHIKAKLDLFRNQRKQMKLAEKKKGLEKAEIYGKLLFQGIDNPPNALKILKECDPAGETPYAKRLEFNVFKVFTDRTYKNKDNPDVVLFRPDEAIETAKRLAVEDETTYLPWQRQEILSACAAYLRRLDKTDTRVNALYKEIKKIDPDSVWASFADSSKEIWGSDSDKKGKKKKK